MVIFRENTEDIYAGIEYVAGSAEAQKVLDFSRRNFRRNSRKSGSAARRPHSNGSSSSSRSACRSATSRRGRRRPEAGQPPRTERLVHSAIGYALKYKRKNVTLVHKATS